MPLPTTDLLLEHVGGLCAAWLRDEYGAESVQTVYTYPTQMPPAGKLPALVVTRESESWTGYPTSRRAVVRISVAYYAPPHAGAASAEGVHWQALYFIARMIDRAVHKGEHADWFGGEHIGKLVGMEEVRGADVFYPAPSLQDADQPGNSPSVQVIVEAAVRDLYQTVVSYDADLLVLDYNSRRKLSNMLAQDVVYDAPAFLRLTPLEAGVIVGLTPGGAFALVEDDRIIDIAFVPGTTTVGEIITAVAANPAADAYLDLTGSIAGTLPIGFVGGTYALYTELVPAGAWMAPFGQDIPV